MRIGSFDDGNENVHNVRRLFLSRRTGRCLFAMNQYMDTSHCKRKQFSRINVVLFSSNHFVRSDSTLDAKNQLFAKYRLTETLRLKIRIPLL